MDQTRSQQKQQVWRNGQTLLFLLWPQTNIEQLRTEDAEACFVWCLRSHIADTCKRTKWACMCRCKRSCAAGYRKACSMLSSIAECTSIEFSAPGHLVFYGGRWFTRKQCSRKTRCHIQWLVFQTLLWGADEKRQRHPWLPLMLLMMTASWLLRFRDNYSGGSTSEKGKLKLSLLQTMIFAITTFTTLCPRTYDLYNFFPYTDMPFRQQRVTNRHEFPQFREIWLHERE